MPNNDQSRRPTQKDATAKPDSAESVGLDVIDDDELRTILEDNQKAGPADRPSDVTLDPPQSDSGSDLDELSLVSTQALQKLLVGDQKKPTPKPVETVGFNPYDKNDGPADSEENE